MALWIFPTDGFLRYEFFGPFQTVPQAFLQLWEAAVHEFSRISKNFSRKIGWWNLGLLMLQRSIFRTQSNKCNGTFLQK